MLKPLIITIALGAGIASPIALAAPQDSLVTFLDYSRARSSACQNKVERGLSTIPRNIRQALLESGYSILIAPTMLSAIPGWQGATPRGWSEDSNYDNVGGLFQSRSLQIIIPEQVQSQKNANTYLPNDRAELAVRHEVGHAYDHFQGLVSQSDAFVDAYYADFDKLNKWQQGEFAYFLQPDGAGSGELFAELFAAAYTPDAESNVNYRELLQAFPRTTQLMMKLSPNRPANQKTVQDKVAATKPSNNVYQRKTGIDPMAAVEKARLSGDRNLEMRLLQPLIQGNEKDNPVALFYYAVLLRDQRRRDEARQFCQRAMELAPQRHWVAESARRVLTQLKDPSQITSSATKGGRIGYIGLRFHDNEVMEVVPGSPAELAHIARGDIIISVDDTLVTKWGDEALMKKMRGLEGMPIKLVIERNGKRYGCTVTRGQVLQEDYNGPTEIKMIPAIRSTR